MPSPIESNNYKSLPGGRASLTYARAVLAACLLLSAETASGQSAIPLFKPGAIRVLTISGRNNHDWRTTTPFMRDILNRAGRFDVRVNGAPQWGRSSVEGGSTYVVVGETW
jgi:hypothetical protein